MEDGRIRGLDVTGGFEFGGVEEWLGRKRGSV
jgi:hypothetical protein